MELLGREVLRHPQRHQQRGVTFVEGLSGEQPVAPVGDALLVLEDREVLVLQRVVELVGEGDLLVRTDLAGTGHDVQRLLVVAVEAGDAAAEHLDREVAEVRVRREQVEGLVEALVRGDQLGRRLLLVELLHLRGELGLIERLAGHVPGRLEAAEGGHLLLDLVVERVGCRWFAARRGGRSLGRRRARCCARRRGGRRRLGRRRRTCRVAGRDEHGDEKDGGRDRQAVVTDAGDGHGRRILSRAKKDRRRLPNQRPRSREEDGTSKGSVRCLRYSRLVADQDGIRLRN